MSRVLIAISITSTLRRYFDTVNSELVWKVLGVGGVHSILVRSLHSDMNAWVNFNSTLVSVVNRVKQGCILASQLFAIFFAVVFKIALRKNVTGIYTLYRYTSK